MEWGGDVGWGEGGVEWVRDAAAWGGTASTTVNCLPSIDCLPTLACSPHSQHQMSLDLMSDLASHIHSYI